MGLPIWREPSDERAPNASSHSHGVTSQKPPSDLTPNAQRARSTIRRHNSVRYPHGARPNHLTHAYLRGSIRSPPPAPPNREIPPVPSLPSQNADETHTVPPVVIEPPLGSSRSWTVHSPPRVVSEGARPRSRRGTILTDQRPVASPSAIDELPPLRRMGRRSINERSRSRSPNRDRHASFRVPGDDGHFFSDEDDDDTVRHLGGGLGDRTRSPSVDGDQWNTLLTTITPDPSLPSAETSFTSATASFGLTNAEQREDRRPRSFRERDPLLRPLDRPLSPRTRPTRPPTPPYSRRYSPYVPSAPGSRMPLDPQTISNNIDVSTMSDQTPGAATAAPASQNREINECSAAWDELQSAIRSFSVQTARTVVSLRRLANSLQPNEDLGPIYETNDQSADQENRDSEVRALVEDVNALHDSLLRTVRTRAERRAQRVSQGADPFIGIRDTRVGTQLSGSEAAARTMFDRPHDSDVQSDMRDHTQSLAARHSYYSNMRREEVFDALRSSDDEERQSAVRSLPSDLRTSVLGEFARSRRPRSLMAGLSAAARGESPVRHDAADQQAAGPADSREAERRLDSARDSLREMERALAVMEASSQEPEMRAQTQRELEEARSRLERMRRLLREVEGNHSTNGESNE